MIDELLIASLSVNDADIEAMLKGSPGAGKLPCQAASRTSSAKYF